MQTLLEKHIHAKSVRKVLEMTSENSSFSLENPDMPRPRNHCGYGVLGGGEREIRTLGTFDSSHDFQVEKTGISGVLCHARVRGVMAEMA